MKSFGMALIAAVSASAAHVYAFQPQPLPSERGVSFKTYEHERALLSCNRQSCNRQSCVSLNSVRDDGDGDASTTRLEHGNTAGYNRRDVLQTVVAAGLGAAAHHIPPALAETTPDPNTYTQRFPSLFDPLLPGASFQKRTIKRRIDENIWMLEQTLSLGPLETPLRCVVIRLKESGKLWVHAPLAPTEEFFRLVESCAHDDGTISDGDASGTTGSTTSNPSVVAHVVVPTYALEHKLFAKDALRRWENAQLWTSPGQFSFPIEASDAAVWGRAPAGVLYGSDVNVNVNDGQQSAANASAKASAKPPWTSEIQYETLFEGSFPVLGRKDPLQFYETAFFHVSSKTLLLTDAVCRISATMAASTASLATPDNLLLISKQSTADPGLPDNTVANLQTGYEKNALLISYFFPEHEELANAGNTNAQQQNLPPGTVVWTEGWHDNFQRISNRLIVPPVVRYLIYPQNPRSVAKWVDTIASRWEFTRIVPAHWDAPIETTPQEFRTAFRFLGDEIGDGNSNLDDTFPERDLERGLRPIADLVYPKVK